MKTVNMHEAKTHLSRLVEAAAKGEPFVIARAGKPLVKVVALEEAPQRKPQLFGFLADEWGHLDLDPELDRRLDEEVRRLFDESAARSLFPEGHDEAGGPLDGNSDGLRRPA